MPALHGLLKKVVQFMHCFYLDWRACPLSSNLVVQPVRHTVKKMPRCADLGFPSL